MKRLGGGLKKEKSVAKSVEKQPSQSSTTRTILSQLTLFFFVALVMAGCILSTGCASKIVLHPVTDEDIKMVDGWVCMTPDYIQEVMKARLGE